MPEEGIVSTAPQDAAIPVFAKQTVETLPGVPEKAPQTDTAEDGEPVQKTPGEAPEAKPEDPGKTDEQPEKQGKHRFERKLDKAYKKFYEEKARADFLEKQIAELKPKESTPVGAPRLEDFSDIQEYAKAYAKFEFEAAIKKYQHEQNEGNFKRATQQLAQSWEEKTSKADKKYDDFDEIVGELIPNNPVTVAIMQAENGEDIAYYLGTHLKEAQRIAGLDPLSQAREIGRLEARLLSEPPKPKTVSKAPAPISPIGTHGSSTANKKLSEMTQDEFEKRRKAQIAARR